MNKKQYLDFHKKCAAQLVEITKRKNSDYTGASNDPFANFRSHGALGFHVRMHDKMSRIKTFIEKGFYKVKDESFLDTCLDLANYAILLSGFMLSQKGAVMGKKAKKAKKAKKVKKGKGAKKK